MDNLLFALSHCSQSNIAYKINCRCSVKTPVHHFIRFPRIYAWLEFVSVVYSIHAYDILQTQYNIIIESFLYSKYNSPFSFSRHFRRSNNADKNITVRVIFWKYDFPRTPRPANTRRVSYSYTLLISHNNNNMFIDAHLESNMYCSYKKYVLTMYITNISKY